MHRWSWSLGSSTTKTVDVGVMTYPSASARRWNFPEENLYNTVVLNGKVDRGTCTSEDDIELALKKSSEDRKLKDDGPPKIDPSAYPDGGFEAWLVVAGTFCCLFCSFGWINCIGVFQDYYQTHQLRQYAPSVIAWIPSLETFMLFFGGPFYGKLYDNYGPRPLLLFGTLMHVFGLMMTSLASKYYQFILAQGICSSIGASAIFYPAINVIGTWFFRNRALALGVTISGASLGGVVYPLLVQHLVEHIGFGWIMRVCAFLMLALMIVANLTVRSRLPPSPKPFVFMDFIDPLKELPFVFVVTATYLFFFGIFIPFNFLITQAVHEGMSLRLAAYLIPILNGASLIGRIIPGFIGDRIGRFNMQLIMTFSSALFTLCLWLPSRSSLLITLYAALFGFSSGGMISLVPALVVQISDIRSIGVRTGTLFAMISTAALLGNPVGGSFITRNGGEYWGLQTFAGVMMLAGSCFYAAARVRLGGWGWVKV